MAADPWCLNEEFDAFFLKDIFEPVLERLMLELFRLIGVVGLVMGEVPSPLPFDCPEASGGWTEANFDSLFKFLP